MKKKTPAYWKKAVTELSKKDKVMAKIIAKHSARVMESRGDAFATLARSIVGQQISVKAAQSVWKKVDAAVAITPEAFLEATPEKLRACGLSERKVSYVKDLAKHFTEGKINLGQWHTQEDEEIIEQLTQVKGIGRWTAEMFMMFHLLRPNVFPKADLGLHKAISLGYGVRYPVTEKNLKKFNALYAPWSSVAVWYLWRSLEG